MWAVISPAIPEPMIPTGSESGSGWFSSEEVITASWGIFLLYVAEEERGVWEVRRGQ